MKASLFTKEQGRIFVVTRWHAILSHGIEDKGVFLYKNEKKLADNIVYSKEIVDMGKRTLADLIWEFKHFGKINETDIGRMEIA